RRHEPLMPGGLVRRLVHARLALAVAAMVFALLVHFAGLAATPAVIGLATIALAVLAREAARPGADEASLYGRDMKPPVGDRAVEAIIAGLADPAIALTPDGLVVAFNASMQLVTPGILRGDPISF